MGQGRIEIQPSLKWNVLVFLNMFLFMKQQSHFLIVWFLDFEASAVGLVPE